MAGKTLAQITESIIKQIKPHITDDQPLSEAWIQDEINDSRAALVRPLYTARDMFAGWHQTLALEAEDDSSITIDGVEIEYEETFKKIQLPGTLIDGMEWKNIQYLGAHGYAASSIGFQRVNVKEFVSYGNHRFGSTHPCYFVNGDVIYVKNSEQYLYLLTACFHDPRVVSGYNVDTSEYPIPQSLHRRLEMITFQHIAPKLNLPIDLISNHLDESRVGNMQEAIKQSLNQQPE